MQKFTPEKNTEVPNAFKMLGSYLNIQLGAIQVDVFNGWLCDHATWVQFKWMFSMAGYVIMQLG